MTKSAKSTSFSRRIEILLAVLSGAVVIAMAAYLLHAAFFSQPSLVALSVTAGAPDADGNIRFTVRNDGEQTAANVHVTMVVGGGGTETDRRTVQIDYVPAHSEVEGALILADGEFGLQRRFVVEGYIDP
jgi:uncharacterized protein (TIGR02588 family)